MKPRIPPDARLHTPEPRPGPARGSRSSANVHNLVSDLRSSTYDLFNQMHNLLIRQYNLSGFVYNLRSFAHNLRNQDRNLRTPILKRAFLEPNNDSAIGGFPSIWRAATSAEKARYQTPVRRFAFKLRRFAPQSRRFALRLRRFTYQPRKFTPLPTCSHRSAVRQLRSRCPLLRGFVLFRRSAASLTLPRRSAASFTLFLRPSVPQPPSHRHITPIMPLILSLPHINRTARVA